MAKSRHEPSSLDSKFSAFPTLSMKPTFESLLPKDLLPNTGTEKQMTDAKNEDEN